VLKEQNYYAGPLGTHGAVYPKGMWVNASASIHCCHGELRPVQHPVGWGQAKSASRSE
jgi:hypothetical protein